MKQSYHLIRNFFISLCALGAILLSSEQVHASHMMGATIGYTYLGNGQYHVVAKVFRDCRGISFNAPSVGWFAGANGGNGCGNGALSGFTRTSISDISNVCKWDKKPCNPKNTFNSGEGMEVHIYEDTIDIPTSPFPSPLSSSSCSDLTIYIGQCCRTGAITTGPAGNDFFATCIISVGNLRKCSKTGNNSVSFRATPLSFVCCNYPVYFNSEAIDTADRDSISYHFVAAINSLPNNSVSYSSPFSYDFPVSSFCIPNTTIKCTPNPGADPPRGLFMDAKLGDVIFTPTKCDEVPVMVIEAREYRKDTSGKYLQVGVSRYDMQFFVKDDCDESRVPKITGTFVLTVNAGDTICTTFTIEDKISSPNQTAPDTLLVGWNGESPNATFTAQSDTFPNLEKVDFCWATKKSDGNTNPWHFYINANDQHCNRPLISSRGILVYVKPQDSSWMNITAAKCNQFTLKGSIFQSKTGGTKFDWKILDSATGQTISTTTNNNNFLTPVLPKGSYKITMMASNGIYFYEEIFQYLRVTTAAAKVELGNYRATCFGTAHTFKALDSFAKAPVKYAWTINGVGDTAKSNVCTVRDIKFVKLAKVTITDANGCVASDTVTCGLYLLPQVEWKKVPLNAICETKQDLYLNDFILYPDSATRTKENFQIWGSKKPFGPNDLVDSMPINKFYFQASKIDIKNGTPFIDTFTLQYRDPLGCVNSAKTSIRISPVPDIELEDKVFCTQRGGYYFLDSAVLKPKSKFGTLREWQVVSTPAGVSSSGLLGKDINGFDTFFLGTAGDNSRAGIYKLTFKVTDQVTACFSIDTLKIEMVNVPTIQKVSIPARCQFASNVDLTGLFQLNGNYVDGNFSSFKIKAHNGDTDRTKWSNVSIIGNKYFPSSAKHGIWTIECTNSQSGCTAVQENTLELYAKPEANFTTNPADSTPITSPFFSISNTTTIASSDNLTYSWNFDFPNTGNTSTATAPTITYPATNAEYVVQMIPTSSKGCKDTAVKILRVGYVSNGLENIDLPDFKINAFFQISGVAFKTMEMRVFDATGKLLRQAENNGKIELPSGIYYYQIQLLLENGQSVVHLRGKMPVLQH